MPWLFRRELTLRDSSLAQAVQSILYCGLGGPRLSLPQALWLHQLASPGNKAELTSVAEGGR